MEIIILAGGFGTRLKSILGNNPKPLANINGKPFLFFLLQNLIKQGFNDFIFSLHYEANKIIEFIESEKLNLLNKCKIQYIVEPEPLGTGGAISYILTQINLQNTFLVINSDTWLDHGHSLVASIEPNIIGLVQVDDVIRYGHVEINEEGLITRFIEKNDLKNSGTINAGIYNIMKSNFSNNVYKYSIEDILLPKMANQGLLKGIIIKSTFIDIGITIDYDKFCNYKIN
jgi:D-glycero-alpha-D-manno-heptose 1-phosphate guanylyltransferase